MRSTNMSLPSEEAQLPLELLAAILSFIEGNDLVSAALVNKTWYLLAQKGLSTLARAYVVRQAELSDLNENIWPARGTLELDWPSIANHLHCFSKQQKEKSKLSYRDLLQCKPYEDALEMYGRNHFYGFPDILAPNHNLSGFSSISSWLCMAFFFSGNCFGL